MNYEQAELYIPAGKRGWRELGWALVDLPADGWELFMAVPIIELTAIIPGISGSRTTTIIHYFRRPKVRPVQRCRSIASGLRRQSGFPILVIAVIVWCARRV
jgi:hypothetical protein